MKVLRILSPVRSVITVVDQAVVLHLVKFVTDGILRWSGNNLTNSKFKRSKKKGCFCLVFFFFFLSRKTQKVLLYCSSFHASASREHQRH